MPENEEEVIPQLVKAMWGDRDNLKDFPGVIVELARQRIVQEATDKKLDGLIGSVNRILWLLAGQTITVAGGFLLYRLTVHP